MFKTLASAALAAAAAFAAVPASAEAPTKIMVSYADLDLASAGGSAALEGRIKQAARHICGSEQAPGLVEAEMVRKCRADVISSARPQLSAALSRGGTGTVVVAASR